MFQEINDENEQKQFANKITPQMLGLKPTNDYAQFVNQTICDEAPEKAKIWKEKGPIGVMEAGNMYARELVGDYNNVYTNQAQRNDYLNKHPLIKKWNDSVENREQNQAKRITERNKRVNEGTGSLIDRTGAFLDRIGTKTTKAQIQQADILEQRAMPHKNDPNYKYLPKNVIPGYVSYDEIDLRKKIGFVEGLADSVSSGKATPFFGGAIEGWKNGHIEKIRDKIDNGEQITQRELDEFNRYKDYLYEKQIRGYSIGGEIGESWLPSLVAFGSEMALGGAALKLVGLAGKGLAVGNAVEKGLGKINKFGKVGDAIAKGTGFATGQLAEGGISAGVGTIVNSPSRLWATFSERRLNDKMKITDRGTVIFTQAHETPARAFIKSLESVYLSYFTENMGGLIGAGLIKPISKLAQKTVVNPVTKKAVSVGAEQFKRVLEHCPKLEKFIQKTTPLFARAYEKLNNLPMRSESIDWLKSQVKFDGFLEEMGEEVLEDVLNLTIGTNDEERSLENYVKAIFKTPEEWAVIAGVIGLQGGTISLAGNLLADAMQRSGVPENKIAEVIQNSTENEKHDLISGLLDDGTIQTSDLTDEERARQREIKDDIYQKLTNIGIKNEEANNISILTGSMFEKYGTKNDESRKVFDDYINNLVVKYNIPADEKVGQFQSVDTAGTNNSAEISAAKKEWEEKGTDSKYFKKWFGDSKVVDESGEPLVVYHGTNADFDTFDKKKIGSATDDGLWGRGFYFGNKETSYGNKQMQVYLKMQNPFVVNDFKTVKDIANYLDVDEHNFRIDSNNLIHFSQPQVNQITSHIISKGHDGVIVNQGTWNEYVVFEPNQIKSVNNKGTFDKSNPNIYFQSASNNIVDLTNEFEKAPTIDEVKNYINEIVKNGTKFATLSPNWFVDIKKENSNKKQKRITNKILNKGNYKGLNKKETARYNKYLASLEKLLANAEYAGEKENTKKDKKPNIEKYHYFKTDVKIGNKTYQLIFDTEEYKNSPQTAQHDNRVLNPQSEDTSIINDNTNKFKGDTEEYKNDKSSLSANVLRSVKNLNEDTNSINDNAENINPKTVHLYNIKEIKTPKTYFQEAENENGYRGYFLPNVMEEKLIAGFTYPEVMEKMDALYNEADSIKDEEKQKELLVKVQILQDAFDISEHPDKFRNEEVRTEKMLNAYYVLNNQEIPKDYIEENKYTKRTLDDAKAIRDKKKEELESKYYKYYNSQYQEKSIMTIMSNADASTALHEFGHLFLDMLVELAKVNEDARIQLDAVNKWLGYAGEYTTAQHEKFANNFVAYLYKGKAPNNKLRTVFENFKEWLKSVYNHILDIPNVDISDEVQELFDNIFGDDNYYEERKQATQLLKKIKNTSRRNKLENVPERKDKSLTDTQKRCKQASYEILSVATGKDINYLKRIFETSSNKNGYAKRREIVEELLENADDRITASGGMRENWKEFYGDTGVSYENDEINGDFELAEKALDTIINKDYFDPAEKIDNQLQNEAEYYEKAIDNANREYKILLRAFKNENRNVVLATAYEWLDKLPEKIKQDYEDKFIFDTRMIERDENANKFDKAKRRILAKAMELQNNHSLNKNEAYKELVLETVKNLSFLQPLDKAKLTTNILDVPSANFLMSSIDNILDIAKTMEDVNLRLELERRIHKEIQQTKNIKKNGRTVGKYDYKSNKLFEELRQLDRLTPEQANEQRLENKRFAEKEDSGMSSKERLINEFLSYKAGGRTFANTELMKKLYDEILKIKLAGKTAKSELDLIEKISEEKDIEELISIVQNKKNGNEFQELLKKGYISGVANLESTLNAIFNKDIAQRYGAEILYAETQSQAWQHEQKQSFEKQVAKIYNLPQWHWDKIILEHLSKKHKFTEFRRKYNEKGEVIKVRQIERELTEMDIIQAFIWSKNEILEKRLKNQFGEDTLETMFNLLSKEDEQLAEVMMQTAQSFYPLVNKAFINKYGLDLPKVSCYFPSTPERGSEIDLYNEYSSKSLGNSFTKSRGQSETLPMDFHNPVTTLYSHIDGVAKFAFMSEYLDKANLRFKDSDLKRTIINKYGEDAYRTLEQLLMNVTYKKDAEVFSGQNKIMNFLVSNWIQANVSIKPIVGLKQLLSANNYAVDMPYLTWQKGFLDGLKNPNKTIDYMMNIPYLKARYEGSLTNEFLKQTINNSKYATTKKLKDLFGTFIKMGDIGAIIFGGKPYIDYLIKEKGMSEKEAIKQFVLSTNRSQQSSAVSSLSNFQISMTRNPLGKLFIAYKNSPLQYVRMCADAIISVQNGDMSKRDCAKILFQYAYLQPFLYAIATSGSIFHWVLTGDDDDILKDIRMSIFDLNSSAFPLLGDIYKYFWDKVIYKEKTMVQTTPLIGDIEREIAKIAKDDVTVSDYLGFLAYISLQAGMGINTKAIGSMTSGVGDIATGNVAQGSLKVFGYTDKRAKHIVDDEN